VVRYSKARVSRSTCCGIYRLGAVVWLRILGLTGLGTPLKPADVRAGAAPQGGSVGMHGWLGAVLAMMTYH